MPENFREIGRLGQKRQGGVFYDEFLRDLRGRRGIQTYTEMADNDDIIGSVLFAVEMLIRQAPWDVQPGGPTERDKQAADFVWECMNDMTGTTWTDTVSEILSFLIYGWSAHEIVYKRRAGKKKDPRMNSKYDDGLIGWRKLPIRAQDTLWEWRYGDDDELIGFAQMPPPDYGIIDIPMGKLLLFRTKSRRGSPEGRSILRNAYRCWYFKRRIQEIEGIGIERDLAGFPTLTAPPEMDIWDAEDEGMVKVLARAEAIVKGIRRDAMEGMVLPGGWKLELLSTGGRRQFDTNTIIDRYDTRMAMTVLADFVLLGHQQVGSFALSSDKTKLFSVAIGAYLDIICETFNDKAIPALLSLNGPHFDGITDFPKLTHGDIESPDLPGLAAFVKDMTGVGLLTPDEKLEDYLRDAANLPERIEGEPAPGMPRTATEDTERADEMPDDDAGAVEQALKRLGRGGDDE